MSYPITVTQQSLDHRAGTKSYHFTLISNADGKSVLVFRYGKKGQFGQIIVNTYETVEKAEKAWASKEREKSGSTGGYTPISGRIVKTAVVSSDLVKTVGLSLFNKMGASAVRHIDPTFNTDGMRDVDPPTVGEDGRSTGDTSRKVNMTELKEQQRVEEEARAAQTYAENADFGIF